VSFGGKEVSEELSFGCSEVGVLNLEKKCFCAWQWNLKMASLHNFMLSDSSKFNGHTDNVCKQRLIMIFQCRQPQLLD
jgi:hypothetical protein